VTRSSLIVLLCSLCGCQADSVQTDLIGGLFVRKGSDEYAAYAWSLEFLEGRATVYAVAAADGVVFSDQGALRIGFDGWDVVLVEGMPGAMGKVSVKKPRYGGPDAGEREHRIEGQGRFKLDCPEPKRTETGWLTECTAEMDGVLHAMNHGVELNEEGDIESISASLFPGVTPMVLRRLSADAQEEALR